MCEWVATSGRRVRSTIVGLPHVAGFRALYDCGPGSDGGSSTRDAEPPSSRKAGSRTRATTSKVGIRSIHISVAASLPRPGPPWPQSYVPHRRTGNCRQTAAFPGSRHLGDLRDPDGGHCGKVGRYFQLASAVTSRPPASCELRSLTALDPQFGESPRAVELQK